MYPSLQQSQYSEAAMVRMEARGRRKEATETDRTGRMGESQHAPSLSGSGPLAHAARQRHLYISTSRYSLGATPRAPSVSFSLSLPTSDVEVI